MPWLLVWAVVALFLILNILYEDKQITTYILE